MMMTTTTITTTTMMMMTTMTMKKGEFAVTWAETVEDFIAVPAYVQEGNWENPHLCNVLAQILT
jgi:hypothetical protein